MILKSNRCPRSTKNPFLCWKKLLKPSLIEYLDAPSSLRLLDANTVHLGNAREGTRTVRTIGDNSFPIHNGDGTSHSVPSNIEASKTETNIVGSKIEHNEHAKDSTGSIWRNTVESHSNVDDRKSQSILSRASYIDHKIIEAGECATPDTNATKPKTELISARDVCISMLSRDIFHIKGSEPNKASTTIVNDDKGKDPLFECKTCGCLEDPSHMLICDHCEEAFHLHCCYRRTKKIPDKEWYCLDCSRKKPKRQREKLFGTVHGSPKRIRRPRRGIGPIGDMLVDVEPYETNVRIGIDFQAEVPEWSGPFSGSDDHFPEPSSLDATDMTSLTLSQNFKDKKSKISNNWIQCQEVLDTVVCGKWRRAPLFVVQSSNWDCSSSVLWDPVHADCAVPQELETDEVLEQLKYINKLKKRLDSHKQKRRKCV